MPQTLQPLKVALSLPFVADHLLATLIHGLLQSDATLLARPIVRWARRHSTLAPVRGEQGPAPNPALPVGPFRLADRSQACDMLIFVPRSLESFLIDDATGGYGYSHVGVDCGEAELASGKRVFVEATPGAGVHRSYLDKYGPREFIRIPLERAGVDSRAFRNCVLDKVGQPYDVAEVLTWGQVDDPARQVCSDLAGDCLPSKLRLAIVHETHAGHLGRRGVSIHGPANLPLHIFVSPNAFARFFGAPKGHKISHPDERILPRTRHHFSLSGPLLGLLIGAAVAAALVVGWRVWQESASAHPHSD